MQISEPLKKYCIKLHYFAQPQLTFSATYNLLVVRSRDSIQESQAGLPTGREIDHAYSSHRPLSIRDLIKWVHRCHYFHRELAAGPISPEQNQTFVESVFHEALDCFCGMLAKRESRRKIATLIGSSWNLTQEKLRYYLDMHKPPISNFPHTLSLTVGRANLTKVNVLRVVEMC